MLTANTVLVLIIAGGLVLLSLVTLALAMWHDRVVTAAGPTARIEALKVEIEQQEKLLHNLEDELAERRMSPAWARKWMRFESKKKSFWLSGIVWKKSVRRCKRFAPTLRRSWLSD